MDTYDKIENVKKIVKYVLPIAFVIVVVFLLMRGCKISKNDIESQMIANAKKYISENNLNVTSEIYIGISSFDIIEGTELCSKASGVLVKNENGSLKYTPYLKCDNYESKIVKNKEKIIKLNGDSVVILNEKETFNDPYYTLITDADVIISGEVLSNIGVYEIRYSAYVDGVLKDLAIRKVIRTKDDKNISISGLTNSEEPIITLKGEKNIVLEKGKKYVEPGYTAYDYTDGKISRKVQVKGEVNSRVVGNYVITYTVTNSKGNTAFKTRTVDVINAISDIGIVANLSTNEITKEVKINVTITGTKYKKAVLPDNSVTYVSSFSYTAHTNQIYKFVVYDINDNKIIKEVEVENIDNIKPEGSCQAKVGGGTTQVSVQASDNKGISGYSYILDGKESEFLSSNEYSSQGLADKVSVNIKDLAGNVTNTVCGIEKIMDLTSPSTVIECNGDRTKYNNQINNIIATNGLRTRATAAALGRYLSTEIGVKIPYFWAGGHWHYSWDGHDNPEMFKGVSPMWGCVIQNMRSYMGNNMLPAGMDCTGFVAWILFNSGFNKSEVKSFSGETYLSYLGGKVLPVIDFKGSTSRIKAGDIVWREGHMGFVIDVEGETVTIAHEKGTAWGLVVEKYSSRSGRQVGGYATFTKVSLMDNYYE